MEKYVDVMKRSQELADTMLEGLQHIQKLLTDGDEAQSVYMFENVVLAYTTVERSLEPIHEKLESEALLSTTKNLQHVIEVVVDSFEAKDYSKVQEVVQFTLIPHVQQWKSEMEKAFEQFVVS